MPIVVKILVALGILAVCLLLTGYLFSFRLTQRSYLKGRSDPTEAGLKYENVTFQTDDGISLQGWYIPGENKNRTVIQLHGHAGSMDADIQHALAFHKAGFNVMMFDFRAHGRSGGKQCTFGYQERLDCLAAIDFVKSKGTNRIALVGFSMGGMAALLTAPLTSDVNAVISDGAPARLVTALRVWLMEHRVPAGVAAVTCRLTLIGACLRMGINLFDYEPVKWVGRIAPIPLLLIHGEADQYVPDFDDMVEQAQRAVIWREAGIGHTQLSQKLPEQYQQRVTGFLKSTL